MTDHQLQEAIDKTRMWLSSQLNAVTTPSLKAKEDAIAHLEELQKVQIKRANLALLPKLVKESP